MGRLFKLLDRTARPLPLVAIVATLLVFRTFMQRTLEQLRAVSGESILDYQIGYSRERVLEILGSYGPEGTALYQRFMTFDLVFPLLYSLLFASLLHLILRETRFRPLALAPFVMALADYVENAFFFGFLTAYPDIPGTLVIVANVISLTKFGFGGVTGVAALIAAVVLIRRWFRRP